MTTEYQNFDLSSLMNQKMDSGIFSKTLFKTGDANITFMEMASGEELTEHTSRYAATLHFISGSGTMKLGEDTLEVKTNQIVHMPPELSHSLVADENLRFLIYMHKA